METHDGLLRPFFNIVRVNVLRTGRNARISNAESVLLEAPVIVTCFSDQAAGNNINPCHNTIFKT